MTPSRLRLLVLTSATDGRDTDNRQPVQTKQSQACNVSCPPQHYLLNSARSILHNMCCLLRGQCDTTVNWCIRTKSNSLGLGLGLGLDLSERRLLCDGVSPYRLFTRRRQVAIPEPLPPLSPWGPWLASSALGLLVAAPVMTKQPGSDRVRMLPSNNMFP